MPTNWTESGLLPEAVADSVLSAVQEESAVMALATTRQMPAGVEYLPLAANAPKAEWIETGARKPYQPVEWTAERLTAREIAVVTYVEDAYIQDASFNVEQETERQLGAAIARALDAAILTGADAPPGFPSGGIATEALTGADALEAIDAAMSAVEATGVPVTGIVAGPAIGSALRAAYREAAALPGERPEQLLYGVPVRVSPVWDASAGDAIVGAFEYLVIGIRRDITVETSRDGVLTDESGTIVADAFQDDVTLVRAHARFAAAVGKPIGAGGDPIVPFATARWTAGGTNGGGGNGGGGEPASAAAPATQTGEAPEPRRGPGRPRREAQ